MIPWKNNNSLMLKYNLAFQEWIDAFPSKYGTSIPAKLSPLTGAD